MKKKIKEFSEEDVNQYCGTARKDNGCIGCPFDRLCDENCGCNPRELAQYLEIEIEVNPND